NKLLKFPDNSFTSDHFIADIDIDFGSQWQEQVYARAEFNKTELTALNHFIFFFYVPHNPAGQGSCDLAKKYFSARFVFDNNSCSLIVCRRLGMPGNQEFTRMVLEKGNQSTNWISVDMNIHGGHKNGYLNPFIVKILGLLGFFYDDHLPICGAQDDVILWNHDFFGTSEKLDHSNE